jgi:hypothetical protein
MDQFRGVDEIRFTQREVAHTAGKISAMPQTQV